jgi:hypothetical protein
VPPPEPPDPAGPEWDPLVWVTTGADSWLGPGLGAAAAPLEEVVMGGGEDDAAGDPLEEAAVVTPPIGSLVVEVVRWGEPGVPPAAGCFGLMCLVT